MRHRKDGFKLGRLTQHRWAMFRNLLVSLFRHERIVTTEAKAKAVRGLAEHMITLAKRENLHARRQVLTMVPDTEVVKRLFDTVAARFADRHGGYTRLLKMDARRGDAAPRVILELVDRVETPREGKGKERGRANAERPGRPAAGAAASSRSAASLIGGGGTPSKPPRCCAAGYSLQTSRLRAATTGPSNLPVVARGLLPASKPPYRAARLRVRSREGTSGAGGRRTACAAMRRRRRPCCTRRGDRR